MWLCLKGQLWSVGEEACCPFKHHSLVSVRQLMQPCSEAVLSEMCSLVEAGDYSGACSLHLDNLTLIESHSKGTCFSYTTGRSCDCEGFTADRQDEMQVEEAVDSGYDSGQSYQPVHENNVSSSHSTESSDAQITRVSHTHQECSSVSVGLQSELDDSGICKVQQRIDCDVVARKLHSPVDFYTSYNCLVTGLQSHAHAS